MYGSTKLAPLSKLMPLPLQLWVARNSKGLSGCLDSRQLLSSLEFLATLNSAEAAQNRKGYTWFYGHHRIYVVNLPVVEIS